MNDKDTAITNESSPGKPLVILSGPTGWGTSKPVHAVTEDSFAHALREVLSQEPDIVLMGNMRDAPKK